LVSKKVYNDITKIIGETLKHEIFARSQENLSSKEFVTKELDYPNPVRDNSHETQRKWTITNKNVLKKSGYQKSNKTTLKWEVGYDSPYAYWNNFGKPPHNANFEKLYDWAWYRRNEEDFPNLKFPGKKNTIYNEFMRFYNRYKGKMVAGHRLERKVFVFAYFIMLKIKKKGVEPNFFFSDAVYTTIKDKDKLIKNALGKSGRYKVESG